VSAATASIKFGTDGWRGIIAGDFTFDRVAMVAPIAAAVLAEKYGDRVRQRAIAVGYDRRFMAADFARVAADALCQAGYDVWLAEGFAPTPALSWVAYQEGLLGALVLTASHNPGQYLGLKVKSNFGGSVPQEVTQAIEMRLADPLPPAAVAGSLKTFDPWQSYVAELATKVDLAAIVAAVESQQIRVTVDVMHGAAASGLVRLLGDRVVELASKTDPLFNGGAPEPLAKYASALSRRIRQQSTAGTIPQSGRYAIEVGLMFDGDSDRIAAVDDRGNFLSSQVLIPILMEHLADRRGYRGEVVKTVSTSNLVPQVAALYDLPVWETPIGYKYIADRMLDAQVLIGGEESGGIGYGHHIPERDALLSALYVLEAIVLSGCGLSELHHRLQKRTNNKDCYDRIDLHLSSLAVKDRLVASLRQSPPATIADVSVTNLQMTDGYKFHLADGSWLLVRFSGTEPVLRLYCEAATIQSVADRLNWAKTWALSFDVS
jgi:phosphomannomutase